MNAALRKCEAHAQAGQYRLAIDDAADVARECLRTILRTNRRIARITRAA